jgi:hypothetical protein
VNTSLVHFVLNTCLPVAAIIDIGSASFKYDMRRLTEILAFPKAWYRRSIVRRLFLGDLSISATYSEGEESSPSSLEDEHLLAAPQSLPRSSVLDSRCVSSHRKWDDDNDSNVN